MNGELHFAHYLATLFALFYGELRNGYVLTRGRLSGKSHHCKL